MSPPWRVRAENEVKPMPKNDDKRSVRCSFCGKHQEQVSRIIAGPGAYICNECVQLCMSILVMTLSMSP